MKSKVLELVIQFEKEQPDVQVDSIEIIRANFGLGVANVVFSAHVHASLKD